MPTYDYVCGGCNHAFEEFQSMSAKVLRKCPECGKLKLKRLIGTGAGVIFKGSGFYETDYRSKGYKDQAKAEKEAAKTSTESKDSSKKSETKSETKAESKSAKTDSSSNKKADSK